LRLEKPVSYRRLRKEFGLDDESLKDPTSCGRWRCPRRRSCWSLTSLREKLIKIGAKVVTHGRYVTFQMAEVSVSRQMFANILSPITPLPPPPAPA
jgi:hypothetical protein